MINKLTEPASPTALRMGLVLVLVLAAVAAAVAVPEYLRLRRDNDNLRQQLQAVGGCVCGE